MLFIVLKGCHRGTLKRFYFLAQFCVIFLSGLSLDVQIYLLPAFKKIISTLCCSAVEAWSITINHLTTQLFQCHLQKKRRALMTSWHIVMALPISFLWQLLPCKSHLPRARTLGKFTSGQSVYQLCRVILLFWSCGLQSNIYLCYYIHFWQVRNTYVVYQVQDCLLRTLATSTAYW